MIMALYQRKAPSTFSTINTAAKSAVTGNTTTAKPINFLNQGSSAVGASIGMSPDPVRSGAGLGISPIGVTNSPSNTVTSRSMNGGVPLTIDTNISAPSVLQQRANPPTELPKPKSLYSREWELLRKQAAGNMALAASEADMQKAERLQAVRENAYRGGLSQGTNAYSSMEQRALDEAGQDRMGMLNEAAQENMGAERELTAEESARERALGDEEFASKQERLQAMLNDPTLSKEAKLQAAQAYDALLAGRYGNEGAAGGASTATDILSYEQQLGMKKESGATAGAQALAPNVQTILGLDEATALKAASAASLAGITTEEDISKYQSYLADPRVQENPGLINTELEKLSRGETDGLQWDLIMKSPQWANNKANVITHTVKPSGDVVVGETLILPGNPNPFKVINNTSGKGFLAENLVTGDVVKISNWQITGVRKPPSAKDAVIGAFTGKYTPF